MGRSRDFCSYIPIDQILSPHIFYAEYPVNVTRIAEGTAELAGESSSNLRIFEPYWIDRCAIQGHKTIMGWPPLANRDQVFILLSHQQEPDTYVRTAR